MKKRCAFFIPEDEARQLAKEVLADEYHRNLQIIKRELDDGQVGYMVSWEDHTSNKCPVHGTLFRTQVCISSGEVIENICDDCINGGYSQNDLGVLVAMFSTTDPEIVRITERLIK